MLYVVPPIVIHASDAAYARKPAKGGGRGGEGGARFGVLVSNSALIVKGVGSAKYVGVGSEAGFSAFCELNTPVYIS